VFTIKKVVYFDYGGSHSSVTASNIHAGNLDPAKVPEDDELMQLEYLDKTTPEDFGHFKPVGRDQSGNRIYCLGTKNSDMGSLLADLVNLQGVSEQYLFVGTMAHVNWILRLGGWLSRAVSLPAVGRPLVVSGLKMAYPGLANLVQNTRACLGGNIS
jgi:hypothetical protein